MLRAVSIDQFPFGEVPAVAIATGVLMIWREHRPGPEHDCRRKAMMPRGRRNRFANPLQTGRLLAVIPWGGRIMCQIFASQDPGDYEPVTRHLRLNGQSTSIRLERSFWEIIDAIAAKEGMTTPAFVSQLHSEVLELKGEAPNFTSLLRCACLIRAREQQPPQAAALAAE